MFRSSRRTSFVFSRFLGQRDAQPVLGRPRFFPFTTKLVQAVVQAFSLIPSRCCYYRAIVHCDTSCAGWWRWVRLLIFDDTVLAPQWESTPTNHGVSPAARVVGACDRAPGRAGTEGFEWCLPRRSLIHRGFAETGRIVGTGRHVAGTVSSAGRRHVSRPSRTGFVERQESDEN